MKISILVPTIGRPEIIRQTIARLAEQTRLPDKILVIAVTPEDAPNVRCENVDTEVILAPKGACHQRNRGLAQLRDKTDLIIFFDDDYIPAEDFLAQSEAIFSADNDLVGATGRLVADGINGPGLTYEEGLSLLKKDTARASNNPDRPANALYGCNMVIRAVAAKDLWFDENLPLYAWQEDIDFTYRLAKRGPLLRSDRLKGVHLGVKIARSPGRRLGYSQIANPIYLLRKRTIPKELAYKIMLGNFAANILKSLRPEPFVDRRGRLVGNLIALWDFVCNRSDPRRILDMK
jgi:glycosyltransferase involved in cell wall biosynthesis